MGGYCEKLPDEFLSNKLIHSAIKICEESGFSPEERYAYEKAEDQARWEDSIKGLEDNAVEAKRLLKESKKVLEEKDKALEEKDKLLAESKKEIEELKRLLNSKNN
jgi:chromosome segregation ATPase